MKFTSTRWISVESFHAEAEKLSYINVICWAKFPHRVHDAKIEKLTLIQSTIFHQGSPWSTRCISVIHSPWRYDHIARTIYCWIYSINSESCNSLSRNIYSVLAFILTCSQYDWSIGETWIRFDLRIRFCFPLDTILVPLWELNFDIWFEINLELMKLMLPTDEVTR